MEKRDVLIIGGGPAGSTAASFLAKKGLKVTLFEKEKFPRDHVGESLLPFCHTLFDELGVLPQMAGAFVRKPGVRFVSADGQYSTLWCFDKVINDERYRSFQVERAEFDQMLLENSRRLGAEVFEESRVTRHEFGPDGEVRLEVASDTGAARKWEGRFLIDASGRDTFMGSRMKGRRPNEDLQRTAIWSHYAGVELKGGLEEGNSIIVYLGGDKKGWSWVFPLGVDRITVGFVADNDYIRAQKKKLDGTPDWREALLEQEIESSPFIKSLVAGGHRSKPMFVNADYSYFVDQKYDKRFALIGDAGRFIDPIFSSGVFLSMKSARLVSDALGEMFAKNDFSQTNQLDSAYELINGAYNFVHRMIKLFYNPHALTWAQAPVHGDAQNPAHEHGDAMAAGHYMLAGDFFEKYDEYNSLFDLLENPRRFGHYKTLVIDHERLQDVDCRRDPPDDNFPIKATAASGTP